MELALARVTMPLYTSAEAFGRRMHQPLETFRNVLHTAAHIESTTPRPKSLVDPLLSLLDTLDETADALTPTDVLYHHISLLSIVASSLACVSVQDDLPADVVSVAMDEAQEHLKALRAMSHSSNQQLADAAENVLKKVMNYVTEHLREPLRFVEDSGSSSVVGNDNQGGVGKGKLSEHSAPHLVAYRTNVIPVVDEFEEASSVIGGDVAAQAGKFCAAVRLVYDFVVKASEMKSAPGEEEQQQMLTPIIAEMSAVAEIAAKIGSTHELFNHFKAVEDAVGMVSWIVAESKPTGFVSDAEAAADFYLNKTLVATKKGENAAKHKMFVEALRKVLAANKAYIKEYHTMGLRYGAGVEAKSGMDSTAPTITIAEETEEGDTYVTAFQALIDGPLAAYVEASKVIAAEVAQQAEAFAASWKAEKEFLAKAYNMSPPEDAQPMLAPIAGKMAAVNAIAERVDPRGPISQHCNAVSESVAALGWVAVDERAAVYVADMAAAGQFFLDKVKMGAKNTSNPEAHRTWARCLEMLFADLNAYVKEYHTQKLVWNPPKVNRVTKSAGVPHDDGEDSGTTDYASAFKALIDSPLAVYVKASKAIGGEVAEQAAAFAAAWNEEAEFLAKAINMPKPEDYQDLLTPIANKMSEVSAVADKVDPRGPLMQHCNAVGESVAALGWVAVDEKATAYVGDMAGAGQFFLDKVKMGAKKTDNPDAHRAWVASVETLLAELKTYVKEYHTQKLTWNPPKVKKVLKKASAGYDDDDKSDVDYATAFKALIDGPLATYLKAADAIGGEVATQAASFREAWVAEAEFLDKAINMPKPTDFQDMLAPIASRMGEVGAVLERIDPRGPIVHHCNAVGESVAALGWIAVDGKTTTFVADMAGAGQFFIDKVKMNAKKTNNPDIHRAWASALETLFANLKAYVREYHTHSLVWNPPKATKIKASAISQKGEESRSGRLDSITAFKNLISGPLAAFVQLSKEIGDEVAHQADAFAGAWEAEAEFLAKASKMSKPEDFQEMLAPIAAKMGEVSSIAEKVGFRGALSQHCNAVGESIGALGWVAVDEKATSYVGEIAGAGQFYVDRVKMRARETNKSENSAHEVVPTTEYLANRWRGERVEQLHVEQIKLSSAHRLLPYPTSEPSFCVILIVYRFYPYNFRLLVRVPPPPAPGPLSSPPPPSVQSGKSIAEDNASAWFAEINALGADGVRRALTNAQKGPVHEDIPVAISNLRKTPKRNVIDLGGGPKCVLAGKKWIVEYQNGAGENQTISIDTDLMQTVYIFKYHDSVIKINGKVNAIVIDTCAKTACVLDEALPSVELVNNKDVQIQCMKTALAVSIDGCTAVTYCLSESFEKAQVITAKSAAVDLVHPTKDDDIIETPIPEQFCMTWKNGNWITECVDDSD